MVYQEREYPSSKKVSGVSPGTPGKCSALREAGQPRGRNKLDSLTLADGAVPIPFKTPLKDAELCQRRAEELTEHANKVAVSLTWKE